MPHKIPLNTISISSSLTKPTANGKVKLIVQPKIDDINIPEKFPIELDNANSLDKLKPPISIAIKLAGNIDASKYNFCAIGIKNLVRTCVKNGVNDNIPTIDIASDPIACMPS
ncbi:Uncharacterised protein [Clostridioides difficile]|nr:Uncharacterised protein [Clostridioides difficile]